MWVVWAQGWAAAALAAGINSESYDCSQRVDDGGGGSVHELLEFVSHPGNLYEGTPASLPLQTRNALHAHWCHKGTKAVFAPT